MTPTQREPYFTAEDFYGLRLWTTDRDVPMLVDIANQKVAPLLSRIAELEGERDQYRKAFETLSEAFDIAEAERRLADPQSEFLPWEKVKDGLSENDRLCQWLKSQMVKVVAEVRDT